MEFKLRIQSHASLLEKCFNHPAYVPHFETMHIVFWPMTRIRMVRACYHALNLDKMDDRVF